MIAAVLLASLAASPVDVVISRRLDVDAARSAVLARDLSRALVAQQIADVATPEETTRRIVDGKLQPAEACDARRACVAALGAALGSRLIVGIDLGQVAGRLAVTLEAIRPSDGARVAQRTFTARALGDEAVIAQALDAFAAELVPASKVELRVTDAPREILIVPSREEHAERPSGTPAYLSLGAAAATGAAAVTFGYLGWSASRELSAAHYDSASGPASRLSREDADALASTANTRLLIGGGCLAATAVLSGVAWALWPSPAEKSAE